MDPDIKSDIFTDRKTGWKGIFGQCDAAQGHLSANDVGPGDLFLFYGWFKEVQEKNGMLRYIPGTEKHIIWGYMQIGEIDSIVENEQYEDWKLDHPHYRNRNRINNTGYIAREHLDFNSDLPGHGVFKYNESLVLSHPNSTKRIWKLPEFFYPSTGTKMTYNTNRTKWTLEEDYCILESAARGQEFITSGNQLVVDWAKQLVTNSSLGDGKDSRKLKVSFSENRQPKEKIRVSNPGYVTIHCVRRATGEVFEILYDLEDHDKVKRYHWKIQKNNNKAYAIKQGTQNIFLHRLVTDAKEGVIVKTKNGNYFDCRKENLIEKNKKEISK